MQEKQKKLMPGIRLFSADVAAETGSSHPKLNEKYNVDVREFVVLACLDDDGGKHVGDIASHVGLSATTTSYCLESLEENGLIKPDNTQKDFYAVTDDGRMLIRKSRLAGYR